MSWGGMVKIETTVLEQKEKKKEKEYREKRNSEL